MHRDTFKMLIHSTIAYLPGLYGLKPRLDVTNYRIVNYIGAKIIWLYPRFMSTQMTMVKESVRCVSILVSFSAKACSFYL